MMRTDADALAAVDAPLGEDMRLAVADADRFGGTAFEAVGTAAAQLRVQHDRVKIFVVHIAYLFIARSEELGVRS